ncbi:phosphopeptide-binding protein [Vallitalea longa]|uniref:Phosphopeptide-binding protein n=1 Tax=Vallitalea longa TaxID=2936439 RepID=A0A9W5YES7_9FIRM|nr:DUF6382 domain-containing protein [Vallitalea longa]GKX30624.1 phosphopeptide-binding protein [Vallitalea longa]
MNHNITYQRDAINSYLVMKKEDATNIENYEVEMLERNSLDSFLDISIRTFNAEKELYYNITSKQQLDEILERKKLNSNELVQFFNTLVNIVKNCEKYFLDSNKILLQPNMIYIDLNGFKPSFVYVPFDNNDKIIIDDIINLTNFLFDKIDQEDVNAVMIMHKIMTSCKQPDFNINKIQSIVNEKKTKTVIKTKSHNIDNKIIHKDNNENNKEDNEIISKLIEQNKKREKANKVNNNIVKEDNEVINKKADSNINKKLSSISKYINKSNRVKKQKENIKEKNKKSMELNKVSNYLSYIVLATIQIITIVLFLIIMKSNILYSDVTGKIKIESLLASICMLIAIDLYSSKKAFDYMKAQDNNSKESKDKNVKKKTEDVKQFDNPFKDSHKNRCHLFNEPLVVSDKEVFTKDKTVIETDTMELEDASAHEDDNSDEDETICLKDFIHTDLEIEPYLINEDTQDKIIIDNNPFLIGKLESHVDYIISNSSVSRIHCKIIKDQNDYYIIDLNSKNGTFLNQERLGGNKKYKLDNGMTITISNCEYIFRKDM